MIRLIDLILENDDSLASKEARDKGLDNLGFGRWGKDGKVTHVSQNGKLVAFTGKSPDDKSAPQSSDGSKSQPNPKQSSQDANQPATTKRKLGGVESIGRRRFHSTKGMRSIAVEMEDTFDDDGRISDMNATLSALTRNFGKSSAPAIQQGGEGLKLAEAYFVGAQLSAVLNYNTNTIELSEELDVPDITSKPISDWTPDDTNVFRLYIHETLHSVSPRIGGNSQFYTTGRNIAIEEGLTEYLAQELTKNSVDAYLSGHSSSDINNAGAYEHFVTGIECMAKLGKLDVDAAFRAEDGSDTMSAVFQAQMQVVENIFSRLGLTDKNLYQDMREYITSQWIKNDSVALMEPEVAETILFYHEQLDNDNPVDVRSMEKTLAKMFRKVERAE